MTTVRIKDGTPVEGVSLCRTCTWGVARKGYRTSDDELFCRLIEPNRIVPFTVRECSAYNNRTIPTLYSMEKIAWVLLTKSAGRSIGFVTGERFREIEGDGAEILPAAAYDETKG
jgi:hypothetical protein